MHDPKSFIIPAGTALIPTLISTLANSYRRSKQQHHIVFPSRIAEVRVAYSHRVKDSDRYKIACSDDAIEVLRSRWKKNRIQYVEEFKVILLDRGNRVLGVYTASQGGQAGCVVNPKIIFGVALKANSSAILISHYVSGKSAMLPDIFFS
ncbi:MAG: JAB domain-containing protein [Bacteroidota bacterium]